MLRGGTPIEEKAPHVILAVDDIDDNGNLDVFMTDKEITNKSQEKKAGVGIRDPESYSPKVENKHLIHLRRWVKTLPNTKPTSTFGDFRFDVDAIIDAMRS
jgi:hypothetical protein